MKEYLKNILPKIKKFSQDLDTIEVLVDKSWVFIDSDNNIHAYTFLRDNRLIISINGNAQEGKWELLPTRKLYISKIPCPKEFQKGFIDDALCILKKSDSDDDPFILINKEKIPDLNVEKYLNSILKKSEHFKVEQQAEVKFDFEILKESKCFYPLWGWHKVFDIKFSNGLLGYVFKGGQSGKYFYFDGFEGKVYCLDFEDAVIKLFKYLNR